MFRVISPYVGGPATIQRIRIGATPTGICGVAAAVANAVYNATGIPVRDYPITLDKLIQHLPSVERGLET